MDHAVSGNWNAESTRSGNVLLTDMVAAFAEDRTEAGAHI
jgi:hypothetical protein